MTNTLPALAAAMLLAAGMGAHAATAAANREATALDGAPTSLAQAIATAERQTGGHAYDAGVDLAGGRTRIIVETNGPQGVQTVTLDARSGQVVGTHAGAEPD